MNEQEKLTALQAYLKSLGSVAVAFSGGVDSTFLLKVAQEVLPGSVIAVTARSCSFPERELKEAIAFTKQHNIPHVICESEELHIEGFSNNPVNRCYLCKTELFTKLIAIASEHKMNCVAEGSNADDMGDYRPGLKAVEELGVKSPLRHVGLNKAEIRSLSKAMGLPTWEKQSFACLSSRFVYGERITEEKLKMVDLAEQLLLDMGFRQVRVRIHGNLARIEVAAKEMEKLLERSVRETLHAKLKEIGFAYVTVDMIGYRTGSMNETL